MNGRSERIIWKAACQRVFSAFGVQAFLAFARIRSRRGFE
jgi:hypothetical protein